MFLASTVETSTLTYTAKEIVEQFEKLGLKLM